MINNVIRYVVPATANRPRVPTSARSAIVTVYRAPDELTARTMLAEPAAWLSVQQVIRSAAEFAISRGGGDNALAAYVSGLEAIGILLPEPAADQTRYEQSATVATHWYVTRTEPTEDNGTDERFLSDAWQRMRRFPRQIPGVGRTHTLMRARGYTESGTRTGYLDRDYGNDRLYITLTHTFARQTVTDDPQNAVARRWEAETIRTAATLDRFVIAHAATQGMRLERTAHDANVYHYTEPMRRTQRLSARVSDAAQHASELAPADAFIRTDDFLRMMRAQAIANHWCAEHHSIIGRLTHGTREPMGVRAQVDITVRQRFTVDVNAFYGYEGSPDGIRQRLEHAAQQMMSHARDSYAHAEWELDERDYSVSVEEHTEPDTESAVSVSDVEILTLTDALPAWSLDDSEDDDERGEWCEGCQTYHES